MASRSKRWRASASTTISPRADGDDVIQHGRLAPPLRECSNLDAGFLGTGGLARPCRRSIHLTRSRSRASRAGSRATAGSRVRGPIRSFFVVCHNDHRDRRFERPRGDALSATASRASTRESDSQHTDRPTATARSRTANMGHPALAVMASAGLGFSERRRTWRWRRDRHRVRVRPAPACRYELDAARR